MTKTELEIHLNELLSQGFIKVVGHVDGEPIYDVTERTPEEYERVQQELSGE